MGKNYTVACAQCGKRYDRRYWSGAHGQGYSDIHCSRECSRIDQLEHSKALRNALSTKIATGNLGAGNELLVCVDLLFRGFEVFRTIAQNSKCDLIARKNGTIFTIEVRTAIVAPGPDLRPTCAKRPTDECDVWAIVFPADMRVAYVDKNDNVVALEG